MLRLPSALLSEHRAFVPRVRGMRADADGYAQNRRESIMSAHYGCALGSESNSAPHGTDLGFSSRSWAVAGESISTP
jgi:hypothetical protein